MTQFAKYAKYVAGEEKKHTQKKTIINSEIDFSSIHFVTNYSVNYGI